MIRPAEKSLRVPVRLSGLLLAVFATFAVGCVSVTVSESVPPDHPANPEAPIAAHSPPPDELQGPVERAGDEDGVREEEEPPDGDGGGKE